ncbi:MAG: nitroreductase family protein [Gammaproteobacteria bacterium]|nr:nitroreductase family protein [Gammaproteobacteria bacterium]
MIERSDAFRMDLLRRRTVRDFESREVPCDVIENALKTAASAPSGANRQPWRFVVVTNQDVKRQIREAAEEEEREFYAGRAPDEWLEALRPLGTDEHKPFLTEAPVLIAIFLERYGMNDQGTRVKNYYMPESVGIATGFLICALHNAGLATLTHTPSPMGFLNQVLGRPTRERPFLLLVVGYPKKNASVPDIEKLPFEKVVSYSQ